MHRIFRPNGPTPTTRAMLKWLAISFAAGALAVFSTPPARAAIGLTELPATAQDGPVTVFYPSSSAPQTIARGDYRLNLAENGAPMQGNGRLIVLSHGSGGAPWVHSDLAQHLAGVGFVVAMPEHSGDNWHDHSKIGPPSWTLRPHEVSHAIDAVGRDPRFATLIDLDNVGMWGMSAGGHTALTLAGGRWSAARLRDHCQQHIDTDYTACTGGAIELKGGPFDGIKKAVALAMMRGKMSDAQMQGHTDPRIKAIIAGVPFATDFDMASLVHPDVALGLVQAQKDIWLLPQFNSGPVLAACKTCELVADLPTGGHGALLSPLPAKMAGWLAPLINDPPGFNRATEMAPLLERTTAFFQKHLLAASTKP
jgi:predicted dienelactone hydrolase